MRFIILDLKIWILLYTAASRLERKYFVGTTKKVCLLDRVLGINLLYSPDGSGILL
ncbi:hypothetical protein [Chryseobacterium piscicola]|uniref:hypothetical protein n=1 Tax=Chryseobacterium piscicola TaxID=551459 RepID=UPI0013FDEDE3|nr:hypothetical protein [Chryseobacterium piscicola]